MDALLETIVETLVELETERSEFQETVTQVFCDSSSERHSRDIVSPEISEALRHPALYRHWGLNE